MYEGRTPESGGMRFGHENMGVVEEVGPAVVTIRAGDRVVMPFNIIAAALLQLRARATPTPAWA